jgi:hypothetical protein
MKHDISAEHDIQLKPECLTHRALCKGGGPIVRHHNAVLPLIFAVILSAAKNPEGPNHPSRFGPFLRESQPLSLPVLLTQKEPKLLTASP